MSGTSTGIYGKNLGSGYLYIKASGFVTGTGGDGIDGYNSASGTSLTIKAAGVYGQTYGIGALNKGTGALSITATQQVTSYLNTRESTAKNYGTGSDDQRAAGRELKRRTSAETASTPGTRARARCRSR